MKWNTTVYVTAALLLATAVAGCFGDDLSLEGSAVQIVDAPDEAATNEPIDVSWRVAGEGEPEQDDDVSVGGNASAGNASAGGNASVDDSADEEGGEEIRTGLVWGYESVSDPQSPGDYENEAANETGTSGETFSASFMAGDPGTVYVSAWAEADGTYVFSGEHTIDVTDGTAGNATGNGTIGGNGTASNNTTAADHTVTISSALVGYMSSYDPDELTVTVGESVVWVNEDNEVHTATGDGFDTGDIEPDNTSEPVVFDTAGEYDYSCTYHGLTMEATIIVEEAPSGNNTTGLLV